MEQEGTETLLSQTPALTYLVPRLILQFSFQLILLNLKYWTDCPTKTMGGSVFEIREARTGLK